MSLVLLLCLFVVLPAPLLAGGDETLRVLDVEIRTADPFGKNPRALFGSTNDALTLDFGGLFLLYEPWRDRADQERNPLEHARTDRLRYAVPDENDRRRCAAHSALCRLPAGRRFSDLRRCRLVLEHGTSYRDWFGEAIRFRLNGEQVFDAPIGRWLGDGLGGEWTVPDFGWSAPPPSPVLARSLELELFLAGGPAWAEDPSRVVLSLVFNLGGRSWRLDDGMVRSREDLGRGRHRWTLRLPLGSDPLRRDEFRLVELYRVLDFPHHPPVGGVPPGPSAVEGLVLRAGDGRLLVRRDGGLLPREGPEGFWFHRSVLAPEELASPSGSRGGLRPAR